MGKRKSGTKAGGASAVSRYRVTAAPRNALSIPPGSPIAAHDLRRLAEGSHFALHDKLGARPATVGGDSGFTFGVWAPSAESVSVVGSFNDWPEEGAALHRLGRHGVWAGFVPGVQPGDLYKFHLRSAKDGYTVDKADPFAFRTELPPSTASVATTLDYRWNDGEWLAARSRRNAADAPMSVYEVHLGSWRRPGDDPSKMPNYRQLADQLVPYLQRMNFTHVELMPPQEHPFYGSWGYQSTSYFAPSSRYGEPQDLMYLVDQLHQANIGVILDWVPSHFPGDEHGLAFFDGTRLFEYPDPKVGYHPDWKSYVFNYGRPEVQSFLISSALFWIDRYHFDAIRVDAVASMLYLDYSRSEGEWVRNKFGGRENLEAIEFLRRLNHEVHQRHPDVRMIAEESTAWPMVSRPVHLGGLGFDMKWDMGWMHDSLEYFSLDPIHRKFHHSKITFRMVYAFSENFMLSLSHDEVVHGKSSLLGKMAGDEWQKFANLRALYGYMWSQPGKKLLFMGGELGQWKEWNHDSALDWELEKHPLHAGLQQWVADLNRVYRLEPALRQRDFEGEGFQWVDCSDSDQSVVSFLRKDRDGNEVLVVCNFTPVTRANYRVGVPRGGRWRELLNSDAGEYGGSGIGNMGGAHAVPMAYQGQPWSINLTLPPLGVLYFKLEARQELALPAIDLGEIATLPQPAAAAEPEPAPKPETEAGPLSLDPIDEA